MPSPWAPWQASHGGGGVGAANAKELANNTE